MSQFLNQRPIVVALAGPNGAGKTTFYRTYLRPSGLRFVNADVLALELGIDAYKAAKVADELRRQLIEQRDSFIFETVFSDPVGDKLSFLKEVERSGYTVALFFIGIENPEVSDQRVAMRVLKGGHDVPADKIIERYPRVMNNLKHALKELSNVRVYDNSDLKTPYRLVAQGEWAGN
jgi:predicted ABC-type ATPase